MEQFVAIEQVNGHYVAASLAFPDLRAEAETEALAVAGVKGMVAEKLRNRKIVRIDIDISARDLMRHFGIFSGEAAIAMQEICDEAYRQRDAERDPQSETVASFDPSATGLSALFGKYRDDETLTEIREEAYRQRDAATLPGTSHDSV